MTKELDKLLYVYFTCDPKGEWIVDLSRKDWYMFPSHMTPKRLVALAKMLGDMVANLKKCSPPGKVLIHNGIMRANIVMNSSGQFRFMHFSDISLVQATATTRVHNERMARKLMERVKVLSTGGATWTTANVSQFDKDLDQSLLRVAGIAEKVLCARLTPFYVKDFLQVSPLACEDIAREAQEKREKKAADSAFKKWMKAKSREERLVLLRRPTDNTALVAPNLDTREDTSPLGLERRQALDAAFQEAPENSPSKPLLSANDALGQDFDNVTKNLDNQLKLAEFAEVKLNNKQVKNPEVRADFDSIATIQQPRDSSAQMNPRVGQAYGENPQAPLLGGSSVGRKGRLRRR